APLEKRRPVRAGENADLALDRADVARPAPVGPRALLDNQAARQRLLEPLERFLGHRAALHAFGVRVVVALALEREVRVQRRLAEFIDLGVAVRLALDPPSLQQ